ncbi:MAG: dipeptide epimerase [Congregibacter sp.]
MDFIAEKITFDLAEPFNITGHEFTDTETVRVTLRDGDAVGRGETVGTYYLNETADSMLAELEGIDPDLIDALDKISVSDVMPLCGARNALDCAFWDLKAKKTGRSIWDLLNLVPKPLTTVYTISMDTAEAMAAKSAGASRYPHLKLKLNNEHPIEKLEAIRAARPDAELIIDVNQGWNFDELREYLPHCARLGVRMIEQPLPRGADEALEGFRSSVPLGADESCLGIDEFDACRARYDVLNIKLDKCGGLSEGLALVEAAQNSGMQLMVGNMMGSSLSMAPSYVIGQFCEFVDIDGPLLLAQDIEGGLIFSEGGRVGYPSPALWG